MARSSATCPPAAGGGGGLRARPQAEPSAWRQFTSGFREALVMARRAMAANKMRTLLTMLGIIIGIASVVSIVVVGGCRQADGAGGYSRHRHQYH